MSSHFYPVILAGGSGTRLWPLSRKNFPKQFLRLQGDLSLLQQTVHRALTLPHEQILIVSNEAHYFLCQEQLLLLNAKLSYLLEPCARNTAAAIASTAHYLNTVQGDSDAIMLILPSDHWIGDDTPWHDAMLQGLEYAAANSVIVTFGIKPDSPKTGYGYIASGELIAPNLYMVQQFHEKPNEPTAQTFLASGHYFWNSGMFVCRASTYLHELQRYAPDIFHATEQAVQAAQSHPHYFRFAAEPYAGCRDESIDYAIMEHTEHAVVMPLNIAWSDLGCWTAVAEAHPQDENGNTLHGNVMAQDSRDCLISSEHTFVTALGMQDHIIIATTDAVLVADKRYSQQVKDLVRAFDNNHAHLTTEHSRVIRPWGYYEVLVTGETFKVKRIMVKPGAALSLQMHQHRAEHWVVVGGYATVFNHNRTFYLAVNQSTYIPKQTKHRLSNEGTEPLFVIEIQSGDYFGEDDIIRFDDNYERVDSVNH